MCSTKRRFAVMTTVPCAARPAAHRFELAVYDRSRGGAMTTAVQLDRVASDADHWRYRSADGPMLTVDVSASPSASLRVGDDVEDCFAFAIE